MSTATRVSFTVNGPDLADIRRRIPALLRRLDPATDVAAWSVTVAVDPLVTLANGDVATWVARVQATAE